MPLILGPGGSENWFISCLYQFWDLLRSENRAGNPKSGQNSKIWVFRHTLNILTRILTAYYVPIRPQLLRKQNRLLTAETANPKIPVAWLLHKQSDLWFFGNSSNFETMYLRAQKELEVRTKCVVKARTWSLRRIKMLGEIFSQKNTAR